MEFKIGDKVEALEDLRDGVRIGDIGEVLDVYECLLDIQWLEAELNPIGTVHNGWGAWRFKKYIAPRPGVQLVFDFLKEEDYA